VTLTLSGSDLGLAVDIIALSGGDRGPQSGAVDSVETQGNAGRYRKRTGARVIDQNRDRADRQDSALAALAQQSTKAAAIFALLRPPQRRTSQFSRFVRRRPVPLYNADA
jgi:hypothetical protein